MKTVLSISIILLLFSAPAALAQRKVITYSNPKVQSQVKDWKANRLEYQVGAGATGFLGDLGGQDGQGQPFLLDLDPNQLRWNVSLGLRYYLADWHALRANVIYARVKGSDEATNNPNRRYRNLSFKSPIFELSGVYEIHFLKPKTIHYAGARTTHVFDGRRLGAMVYLGGGFFYYNPKAEYQGQWYALRELNTEGQGLPGADKPYKSVALCAPLGLAVTYLLDRNFKIGLDLSYRITTTDYIDDASGYYYDNDAIRAAYGDVAAYFANPSVDMDFPDRGDGSNRGEPRPEWYTADQPRGGGTFNDTYMFAQLTLAHTFTPAYSNKGFKPKKKRKAKMYENSKKKNKSKKRRFKNPNLNFGSGKRSKGKVNTF